jgi:acyl carrier protein
MTSAEMRDAVTPSELEERVLTAVADALELDVADVELDASLLVDLGAESLDLLDLSFRIERQFNIALPRVNLLQHAEEVFGRGSLVEQGRLTDLGLRVLAAMRPEIDRTQFQPGLTWKDVAQHLTPRTFVRLTQELLVAKQAFIAAHARCPACGSASFQPSVLAPEMTCAGCEQSVPFPSGDQLLLRQLQELRAELGHTDVAAR